MSTNNPNTNEDLSFLEDEKAGGLQFKDILFLVLHNLHWFILCALICGGLAYYNVKGKDRIYSSATSILLKTGTSGGSESFRSSALMSQVAGANGVAVSTINNEIIIIKSQTLMENVVRRLNLNTMYSYTTRLAKRNKTLYKDSPIEVTFPGANEQLSVSMIVTPKNTKEVVLSNFNEQENAPAMTVKVGEEINSPVGKVVIEYTWFYNDFFNGTPILVRRQPVAIVAAQYRQAINVARDDEKNTILNLSLADTSPTRAADVLNTLVEVYNEDSMEDQKRILAYSTKYIDDRIAYLDGDIDSISRQVVNFQQRHNIIDLGSYGQSFVASSTEYSQELKELEVQRGLAQYLLEFVQNNKEHDLIPSNMGLKGKTATLIDKYDEVALQMNKYKQAGTMNNPQAQAKMAELLTMESSVVESLVSYIAELDTRIRSASQGRQSANAQVQAVPVEQLRVRAIESKKQIKEGLLLTMLTKREELLLNEPKIEPSCKVIDQAWPNYAAIAPNPKKEVLRGILIGLLIPVIVIVLRRLLDTRIHFRGDVEKLTKTPFLGEIPFKEKAKDHAIVVKENGRDSVSEAFRLVRSNLEYMKNADQKGGQVVMFTSFIVASGKTFVSTNLASSGAGGPRHPQGHLQQGVQRASEAGRFELPFWYCRQGGGLDCDRPGDAEHGRHLLRTHPAQSRRIADERPSRCLDCLLAPTL